MRNLSGPFQSEGSGWSALALLAHNTSVQRFFLPILCFLPLCLSYVSARLVCQATNRVL